MTEVVNIAGYQFVQMDELPSLRKRLIDQCRDWGLRGSILISPEGINLFVAGSREATDALLAELRALPGLASFTPKVSLSAEQPFNRMLVKIKREIIAFGVPGIEPAKRTSPKLAPRELKRWLDEGRPLTLLDTRNDYEVQIGTFENAVTLGLDHFRNFPAAVEQLSPELKQKPIVMFCTGGIRCEKAGPYMERAGFQQVFQLEGGILKYFEECGGAHYSGECFVFDRRIGVDASLAETENTQCFACQAPLSPQEKEDSRYIEGQSCPNCFLSHEERMQRTIAERAKAIARVTNPLPGSTPYEQIRPVNISAKYDGQTLLETLCGIFPQLSATYWKQRFAERLLLDANRELVNADQRVRGGERYLHRSPFQPEPQIDSAIRLPYEDEAIVVIEKPAPLPMHPSGRFTRNTLQWILNEVYYPQKLRPVHRLDANTTGLVVFARTRQVAGNLQPQFATGGVTKEYLARILGHPPEESFICAAAIGKETTALGARDIDNHGIDARTEFQVLSRLADETSLISARPITGRTNQIRVHLWHLGWPIMGDQAYLPGGQLGETQTHAIGDPPLCLHARRISFWHPLTNERMSFECEAPVWAELSANELVARR
jgi:RluA family pseudouridine synthase